MWISPKRRGIAVTNVPAHSTESVVQLVFGFLLEFACCLRKYDVEAKERWSSSADFSLPRFAACELPGKTFGIIGCGAISRHVGEIASAFGMRVLFAALPGRSYADDRVPLAELLSCADVVSLRCPLTSDTARLIN